GENILIEVKNTGSFFEDHLLEKLLSQEIKPNGFGIGILNIHKRIQLTYGANYGLNLFNKEDEDTDEEYAVAQVAHIHSGSPLRLELVLSFLTPLKAFHYIPESLHEILELF
ncbi:MAG: hypothetical protein GX905_10385, partial [Bacteroidales bacterium]|nr:hypothetical protein [Bacteroidales bacterium]